MKPFQNFFHALTNWFTRAKSAEVVASVEGALEKVAEILPHAIPIVEDIAALVPNRTLQQALAAAEKYAVPVAEELTDDPAHIGTILLGVATQAVQKSLPKEQSGAALHLIQTAVQLAVTAVNAVPPTPAK